MAWKRLARKTLVDSKFLKVYEDKVELPSGKVIDDYTVVQKPDFVMIVATDEEGNLISQKEYKYAIDEVINTLPAGHVESGEPPLVAAKRELLEETGYASDDWQDLGLFHDYTSKDCHKAYFVKASNARKVQDTQHEETEDIMVRVLPISQLKEEVKNGEWRASSVVAALVMAGVYS